VVPSLVRSVASERRSALDQFIHSIRWGIVELEHPLSTICKREGEIKLFSINYNTRCGGNAQRASVATRAPTSMAAREILSYPRGPRSQQRVCS